MKTPSLCHNLPFLNQLLEEYKHGLNNKTLKSDFVTSIVTHRDVKLRSNARL